MQKREPRAANSRRAAAPRPTNDLPPTPVGPSFGPGPSAAVVRVRRGEPPEHVFRRLLGAYLGGAEEFVVREAPSLSAPTRAVVRTFCRRTRQPEILSEEADTIHLRDLAYASPVPLDRRLESMGQLVVRFHRDAVQSWSGLPLGEDGFWERRDDEVDREAWYLERQAALRLGAVGPGMPFLDLWIVARSLERIADHAVTLGEAGRRLAGLPHGVGPLATLEQFHRQAMEHLEGVLGARDGAQANDLLDTGEALLASGRAIADRLLPTGNGGSTSPAAAATVARILESIVRTVAYGQDIAQVVLDRSLAVEAPPSEGLARGALLPAA